MNYRLGPFGYFYLNKKEDDQDWQGNWGYLDQQAALKWVHTYAYLFGGDKDRVTIAGWSAGAGSVFAHMTLPSSWPYFQKAAAMGGGIWGRQDRPEDRIETADLFFASAECALDDLECMRNKSATDIFKASKERLLNKKLYRKRVLIPSLVSDVYKNIYYSQKSIKRLNILNLVLSLAAMNLDSPKI